MRSGRFVVWLFAVLTPSVTSAQPVPIGTEFQVSTDSNGGWTPRIASDADGNFVVVWLGPENHIFGRLYDSHGAPRGTEFRVDTDAPFANFDLGILRDIDISAGPAGDFVVVWTTADDYHRYNADVFSQRFDSSGAKIGSEFQVNSYTLGWQYFPAVAGGPLDGFVVAWESYDYYYAHPTGRGLIGQWFDSNGSRVGGEFQVNTYTYFPEWVDITRRSDNSFVFVWQDDLGAVGQIFGSDGVRIGSELQVSSHPGAEYFPTVRADTAGNFVVAWTDTRGDGDGAGIVARRFDSTGSPLAPEFQVNSYTRGAQYNLNHGLFVDADGDFVVTWTGHLPSSAATSSACFVPVLPDGVFAQKFRSTGERAGTEFQVNTATIGTQAFPAVGGGPDGFVIAWMSDTQEECDFGVFAQQYLDEAVCPEAPAVDCLPASRSALLIRRAATGSSGRLVWGWRKNPAVVWDSSIRASAYLMCLYDSSGLASEARITGSCGTESCWGVTTDTGTRYGSSTIDNRGRTGGRREGGLSKVLLRGRGTNLSLPELPLDDSVSVTVQVHPKTGFGCLEATYLGSAPQNDPFAYRNRTP